MMETIKLSYIDKVYTMIHDMEIGSEFIIQHKVNPSNISEFNDIVKDFIRFDNGKPFGFYLEFSSDYTKFRKLHK